jgi:hypothetical protein
MRNSFRYFKISPEVIRPAVMGFVTNPVASRTNPNGTNRQTATQAAMRHAVNAIWKKNIRRLNRT